MHHYGLNDKITIIIVLYNEDYNIIFKTLDKIRDFKKVIIDNSNNQKLKNMIKSEFNIEKYILNEKNVGFSSGYNQGVKLCETEYSLILGPDCVIDQKSVTKLYEKLNLYENCFLTTATSYNEKNQLTYSVGLLPENGEKDFPLKIEGDVCVENALGACMFFRKKDFIDIGLFNELFFIFYSDDDLCRKIKKENKHILQVFDAKCLHTHGVSKVKNFFKKIYLREHYFLLDKLYYFYKSENYKESINKERNKKNNYLIKIFLSLIALRLKKTIYYYAKYTAILKFNLFLKKI